MAAQLDSVSTAAGGSRLKRRKATVLIALCVAVLAGVVFAGSVWWPFRREAILRELENASLSTVRIGAFKGGYFPRPSCVLENVVFQHNPKPGTPPLITAQRITIQGSFAGIFIKHIKSIRVEGMHILVPPIGSSERFQVPARSSIVIEELIADGAVLEVARNSARPPLRFGFHRFSMADVGSHGPATFNAAFSNPEPPGEIAADGKFGPWNDRDVGRTPVSGEYSFQQADLSVFRAIAGILSSSGKFKGTLEQIAVKGSTDVPAFTVTSSSHQTDLQTQFQAEVNALNGETLLHRVIAHFFGTTVSVEGAVAQSEPDHEKETSLDLESHSGRIEDVLRLFTKSKRAPMSGSVSFKAHVTIPSRSEAFLKKLELQGDFGIENGLFPKPETQQGIDTLSAGAEGKKNADKRNPDFGGGENVLSDLKGHVVLRQGTANFSWLAFSIPGADARLHGTYNLLSERIDLRGTLTTKSELYKTSHGFRSFMLKMLVPIFKKHPAGYSAPVKITGTYDHPSFGLDLMDPKTKEGSGNKGRNSDGQKRAPADGSRG